MKRFLICFLIFTSAVCQLFSSNLQKTYTVNDEIYKRVDRLTREAGVIGPSSFSPMPGRVLEMALERIDKANLTAGQRKEYDYLYREIINNEENNAIFYSDDFGFDLGLGANLQVNLEDYDKFEYRSQKTDHRNDNMIPYRYQDALFTLYPKLYFGPYFFTEAKVEIKNNNNRNYESSLGWLITRANGTMAVFGNGYANALAPEIPYRAGLSAGNDYFNLILGRYPHSIGSGITGNLGVGDNFLYQEISNISLISNYFTYNISITRFDQMNTDKNGKTYMSRSEFDGMQQYRVVHRFDLNLFNRIRFAVDLSTIYNSHYGFDLRFLYPFVIAHNYFNYTNEIEKTYFDEANNLMTFHLEFIPVKGLSVNAQFVLDQFQVYFEDKTSVPSAWGGLINMKYTAPLKEAGHLDSWIEFVYTNPFLYLNGKQDDKGNIDYNLDYIVGYHTRHVPEYGYSGYQYGLDTILFALGFEYTDNSGWDIGLKTMFRVQGRNRLSHQFYYNSQNGERYTYIDMSDSVITKSPEGYDKIKTPTGGWENAEYLIQPIIYGSYRFDDTNLEIYASSAFSTYINYNFSQDTQFLPQLSIGIKWTGINTSWFEN